MPDGPRYRDHSKVSGLPGPLHRHRRKQCGRTHCCPVVQVGLDLRAHAAGPGDNCRVQLATACGSMAAPTWVVTLGGSVIRRTSWPWICRFRGCAAEANRRLWRTQWGLWMKYVRARSRVRVAALALVSALVSACVAVSASPVASAAPTPDWARPVVTSDGAGGISGAGVTTRGGTPPGPVTPWARINAPYRYKMGRSAVELSTSISMGGKVEVKSFTLETRQKGNGVIQGPSTDTQVIVGPGTYSLTSRLVWRGYTDTALTTVVDRVNVPQGQHHDMTCTISAPVTTSYNTGTGTVFVPVNCTMPDVQGTYSTELSTSPVYVQVPDPNHFRMELVGWRVGGWWNSADEVTIPYIPERAAPGEEIEIRKVPIGFTFDEHVFYSEDSEPVLFTTRTYQAWRPAPRVNGLWRSAIRTDTVKIGKPPRVRHPKPDNRACASKRDLFWVRTSGEMGYRKVAKILGNRGVEVNADWVDITGDGVPDVYERTRWYAGCVQGYVAQVKFWGTTEPTAARKAIIRP